MWLTLINQSLWKLWDRWPNANIVFHFYTDDFLKLLECIFSWQMFGFVLYSSEYTPKVSGNLLFIPKVGSLNLMPVSTASCHLSYAVSEMLTDLWCHVSDICLFQVHDRAQVFISCSGDPGARPVYIDVIRRWANSPIDLPYLKCESKVKLFILVRNNRYWTLLFLI